MSIHASVRNTVGTKSINRRSMSKCKSMVFIWCDSRPLMSQQTIIHTLTGAGSTAKYKVCFDTKQSNKYRVSGVGEIASGFGDDLHPAAHRVVVINSLGHDTRDVTKRKFAIVSARIPSTHIQ